MYIDSPEFPKRKVVGQKNQGGGGFGYERIQLANYVADQLNNNHKDDAAILQKFRKQAQQYKRNLLRRRHRPELILKPPIDQNSQYANSPILKQHIRNDAPQTYRNLQFTERIQTANSQQKEMKVQQKSPISPTIIRQIVKVPDNTGHKQLIKMLDRKDKQIQKQFKIIKKSEQKINNLKKRLEILEYQNKVKEADRIASLQQNSYQKIKGYISSMSQRLLQNQGLLQQNLSQIKFNQKSFENSQLIKSQIYSARQPKPIKKQKHRKISHPHQQQETPGSYIQNPEPKITYSYKVGNEQQMRQQKFGLNSIITNLGNSRNRLDKLGSFV